MPDQAETPPPLVAHLMPGARAEAMAEFLRRARRGLPQHRFGGSSEDEAAFSALPEASRAAASLLVGHMHFGLGRALPTPARTIALLGDPVRRIATLYRSILATPEHYLHERVSRERGGLAWFVRSGLSAEADNGQVRWLCGPEGHRAPIGGVTRAMLESARRNLTDGCAAVGLAEKFDESLALFAAVLGFTGIEPPALLDPFGDPLRGVPPEEIDAAREATALDAELHASAARLFEARTAAAGALFRERLAEIAEARARAEAALRPPPSGPLPDPLYVFHHIPRSGGQSLRLALMRWFTLVEDYAEYDPEVGAFRFPPRPDLSKLTPGHLLCGHWGLPGQNLLDRYPELAGHPGLRLITFLREPLELATSLHYYEQMHWKSHTTRTLDARLEITVNYSATTLGYDGAVPPTGRDIQRFLDRYWFVGITERMRESFDLLADRLGKPRAEVTRFNAAPRSGGEPSPDAAARFRGRSALDVEIYRVATERFEADLARHAAAMPPGRRPQPPAGTTVPAP